MPAIQYTRQPSAVICTWKEHNIVPYSIYIHFHSVNPYCISKKKKSLFITDRGVSVSLIDFPCKLHSFASTVSLTIRSHIFPALLFPGLPHLEGTTMHSELSNGYRIHGILDNYNCTYRTHSLLYSLIQEHTCLHSLPDSY